MKKLIFIFVFFVFALSLKAQWVQIASGLGSFNYVNAHTSIGSQLFMAASDTNDNGNGRVFVSTNNGTVWSQTALFLTEKDINGITSLNGILYAGADSILWRSTNNGVNWIPSLIYKIDVLGIATIDNYVFAGGYHYTGSSGVYRTSDDGVSWTYTSLHYPVYSFTKLGSNIFAGTDSYGVYISSNNGLNWQACGLSGKHIQTMGTLGSIVYAGTDNGLYKSTDGGNNWVLTSMNSGYIFGIISSGNNLIVSVYPGGVNVSTDNGVTWTSKNQGFPSEPLTTTLYVTNNYVFAATYGNHAWRRPINEIIGVKNISGKVPSDFNLCQNYPNPFNPSTSMTFEIKKETFVEISVYDITGKEISKLVNEVLKPGTYQTSWEASSFTSGVYFCRMTAGTYSESRKMILMK